ncbi:MAG: hypothetical protein K2N94_00335 [Lachnospiraceae bacterium]|nr:hypothetical protein [Lachnospiraceae bacterium]
MPGENETEESRSGMEKTDGADSGENPAVEKDDAKHADTGPAAKDPVRAADTNHGNADPAENAPAGKTETGRRDEILSTVTPEEDALTARETLRDMAVGIAIFSLIFAAAGGIIIRESWLRWVFGVLLGGGTAGVLLWHLYITIDRVLDMDEESAGRYTKRSAMKRLLIAAAAFAAGGLLPQVFHIIGVLLGTFSLKFSAYLQPLTHKVIKFFSKGG